MTDRIKLVQGDFGHKLSVTLTDAVSGAVIDVAAATVRLYFRKEGSAALTATVTGTFPNGGTDGKVDFVWPQGALAASGSYEGEVEIDGGTKKHTIYDKLKFKVRNQVEVT